MDNRFWAAAPIEEIADEIEAKFDEYKKWLVTSGYGGRIKITYDTFYGFNEDGTLTITRDDEEVARIRVNHFKSLVRRLHILVTESKLSFTARSRNSDSKSSIESDLAKGIVEYYNDEKCMNETLSESVLGALIMLEYYVYCPWSYSEGFELGVDGSQVVKTGDQRFITFSPFDVAKCTISKESPWHIVREKVNKFDLASQYPDFAFEIQASGIDEDPNDIQTIITSDDEEDFTYKYTFMHRRTPSLPEGRLVEICAGQVLLDQTMKYAKVPLFRITAGDFLQTVYGDSPTVELVPLQEAINSLYSGTVTNNLNNSVQLIWSADPNLTTRKLSDGQTLVTSASPPQALNLTGSAAENFKMLELMKADQQLLSGVNDIARGAGNPNIKTSGGQALYIAQAIQYVSHLQKSYAKLAGDVGTCLIDNIKKFCPEEMTAYIVGDSKKGQIKTFKAADLMDVERVSVDLGNPMTQTVSGRHELMQSWQQYGVITNPKQVISFLATGNLDQEIESDFSNSVLIKSENEMLRKGQTPVIMLTDLHAEHIVGHNKIYSDPIERENPQLAAIGLAHMMDHINMMKAVPPELAAVLSGQPMPPPPPPGMPPAPGQGPNPTIDTARMPSPPEGTPPEMTQGYEDQLDTMPQEQMTMDQSM
jgi:hypothetical protein